MIPGLIRKQKVIEEAIQKYGLYHADALTILCAVGVWILQVLQGSVWAERCAVFLLFWMESLVW